MTGQPNSMVKHLTLLQLAETAVELNRYRDRIERLITEAKAAGATRFEISSAMYPAPRM